MRKHTVGAFASSHFNQQSIPQAFLQRSYRKSDKKIYSSKSETASVTSLQIERNNLLLNRRLPTLLGRGERTAGGISHFENLGSSITSAVSFMYSCLPAFCADSRRSRKRDIEDKKLRETVGSDNSPQASLIKHPTPGSFKGGRNC